MSDEPRAIAPKPISPEPPAPAPDRDADVAIRIEGLTVGFPDDRRRLYVPVVEEVSFTVRHNEILGLVGESGSGKTQASLAMLGLTQPPGRVLEGRVLIDGHDILTAPEAAKREIRGRKAAMIFQSPRSALNPLISVGAQLVRIYIRHRQLSKRAAREAALTMLGQVGITGPERVFRSYPHQLSGGMAQRVMIGMMVACNPRVLIADEPTTGLDVTIQAQIFELIQTMQVETGMSVLLITHDLGVVAEICDRVAVMQAGRVVEIAPVDRLFAQPGHPYTVRLLSAMMRPDQARMPISEYPAGPAELPIVTAGQRRRAVSVDDWAETGAEDPVMVEIAPDHYVLSHPEATLAAGEG
ncbi:MAG: ABC transporter ATP-binding protein [Thermomicrobiales bacterium]|nr:ABC transporter ATP-binding protein [Thermomicrobiales bacterium]